MSAGAEHLCISRQNWNDGIKIIKNERKRMLSTHNSQVICGDGCEQEHNPKDARYIIRMTKDAVRMISKMSSEENGNAWKNLHYVINIESNLSMFSTGFFKLF